MTHDEMIEAVAKAIYGERDFERLGSDVTDQMFAVARAAIRVIAPAVLDEVDRELAMTCLANSEAPSEWIDGFEAAGQRVRALKTRYEQ